MFLCSRVNETMFKCLEPASVKVWYYICGAVCAWVAGVRRCVCTYASIPTYMCSCVRAHVCTRERTRVRTQLLLCEGSHVCVRACAVHARA